MNTSELEQRMKQLLEEQEYFPADASWEKMHRALHPPASSRNILFLLPAWKIAAGVALLLTTGLAGYLLLRKDAATIQPSTIAKGHKKSTPAKITPAPAPTIATTEENAPAATHTTPTVIPGSTSPVPGKQIKAGDTDATKPSLATQHTPLPDQAPVRQETPAVTGQPRPLPVNQVPEGATPRNHYALQDVKPAEERKKIINLGLAANVGKPSQGNVQYNVGVVARKDITRVLFAEANVSLASTRVNYSENLVSNDPGFSNFGSSDGLKATESLGGGQDVAVNYSSNIIAVGFAPALGVKATRNISLSVGGDVYKSLNRDLKLQQEQLKGLRDASRTPDKTITDWDAGIKAQLDYRIGKQFSVSTQYRQGLTQFILIDGKSLKNSVFNVGLKYFIGK